MKFYGNTNAVWDGNKLIPFIDGVCEVHTPQEIEILERAGYSHQAIDLKEMSYNELRELAKDKGLDLGKNPNKDVLLLALRGD